MLNTITNTGKNIDSAAYYAPPSGGGGSNFLTQTLNAGESITSGLAVAIKNDGKVYKYDITNQAFYGLVSGVARTSATANNPIDIYIEGLITEVGSGWSAGVSYYIASNSTLTSTPPSTSGQILKRIGSGVEQDTILLNSTQMEIIIG